MGFIFQSNDFEALADKLKESLYPKGSKPFDRRLIAVPHLGLKSYLTSRFAKDPDMQVAAGLQIVNLSQAHAKLTKKPLPSALELSLILQHHLLASIDEEKELASYFASGAREKRMGPFCDRLADFFLRCALYGKPTLQGWQERLWKKVERMLNFEQTGEKGWQVHLFGFFHLPTRFFSFFHDVGANFYLYSPCSVFWSDFYSEREKIGMDGLWDVQNLFLSNWGRVGRKLFDSVLESEMQTDECYVFPEGDFALANVQRDCLEGNAQKQKSDESIAIFSAKSRLGEVEQLYFRMRTLFATGEVLPRDIRVFAPDISVYAPFIHAVFADIPFAISDLAFQAVDPVAKGFAKLLQLPEKRFSKEAVLELFASPPFMEWCGISSAKIGLFKKWLEKAHVRWGGSESQRNHLFLQDFSADQLHTQPSGGTFATGLKRLLLGLAEVGDEPLDLVQRSETDDFNLFYELIHSLISDLSPMIDGTKWDLPTWMRYFACLLESYFAIDPTHDLYVNLLQLAASFGHLEEEEIPFSLAERVCSSLLAKKGKSHQPPHLQAIQFSSLKEGAVIPSKVIALLGMQEGEFPSGQTEGELFSGERSYRPKQGETDRFLFLQALLSAKKRFLASYVRDKRGKLGASLCVEELVSHMEGLEVEHSMHHLIDSGKRLPPLFPHFFRKMSLKQTPLSQPLDLEWKKLIKFAAHPLRYYFHEVLGLYPEMHADKKLDEYLLTPRTKFQLVKEALTLPIEEVLQRAKIRGELPLHLCELLAKEQIEKEVESIQEVLEGRELKTIPFDLTKGFVRLFGHLEMVSEEGVWVRGEDPIRFFPHILLAEELELGPVRSLKTGEILEIEPIPLPRYLDYFLLGHQNGSPLLPAFAEALLKGSAKDLQKAMHKAFEEPDEILGFLAYRDPLPSAEVIHANWSPILQSMFGDVYADV